MKKSILGLIMFASLSAFALDDVNLSLLNNNTQIQGQGVLMKDGVVVKQGPCTVVKLPFQKLVLVDQKLTAQTPEALGGLFAYENSKIVSESATKTVYGRKLKMDNSSICPSWYSSISTKQKLEVTSRAVVLQTNYSCFVVDHEVKLLCTF